MNLEIVIPKEKIYEDSANIPTSSVDLDILIGRVHLAAKVETGDIVVSKSGERQSLAISRGFAQYVGDKISIPAEDAIHIDEIYESVVEETQKRAEEPFTTMEKMTDQEIAMLVPKITYARPQILVKKRQK